MFYDDDGNEFTWQMFYETLEMRVVARSCVWTLYPDSEEFDIDWDSHCCLDAMHHLSMQTACAILAVHRFHRHPWLTRDMSVLIARGVLAQNRALMWHPPRPTILCPIPQLDEIDRMAEDHVKAVGCEARVVVLFNMALAGYPNGPILWTLADTPVPANFSHPTMVICSSRETSGKIAHWIRALTPGGTLVVCREKTDRKLEFY